MGTVAVIIPPTVYLDTNIFIYAVEDFGGIGNKLRALFARFDRGELHAVTSELTLAEVLVKPIRDGNAVARDTYTRILQSTPSLTVAPVDRAVLLEAARIRSSSAMKLPDAIHAATALLAGCTTLLTNDAGFESVAGLAVLLLSRLP